MSLPDKSPKIESAFPSIGDEGYTITSPETISYNCIAWAGRIDHLWWWPDPQRNYFWPPTVRREITIDAFIAAYSTLGFLVCESSDHEDGAEKIAIFVDANNIPTHAARQLDSNWWTSKLGGSFDISHVLNGIAGMQYGTPRVFMKRAKS